MIREGFEKAENEIFKEGLCQVEDHYVEPENCQEKQRGESSIKRSQNFSLMELNASWSRNF
jgi:hypothetical protein